MNYLKKLVNLTPHVVKIADADGNLIVEVPPSGRSVRLVMKQSVCGAVSAGGVEVPLRKVSLGEPRLVDLIRPDTGNDCLRDAEGHIFAVRAFTFQNSNRRSEMKERKGKKFAQVFLVYVYALTYGMIHVMEEIGDAKRVGEWRKLNERVWKLMDCAF